MKNTQVDKKAYSYDAKRGYALDYCRTNLKILLYDIEENSSTIGYDLYQCNLLDIFIRENSDKLPNPFFKSRVIKIQNSDAESITDKENDACQCMLINVSKEQSSNQLG